MTAKYGMVEVKRNKKYKPIFNPIVQSHRISKKKKLFLKRIILALTIFIVAVLIAAL